MHAPFPYLLENGSESGLTRPKNLLIRVALVTEIEFSPVVCPTVRVSMALSG